MQSTSLSDHVTIIGAGQILTRMYPALRSLGYEPGRIHILSDNIAPAVTKLARDAAVELFPHEKPGRANTIPAIIDCAAELVRQGSPVIVATPGFAHLGYARAMLEAGARVAVEKPLTAVAHELEGFANMARSIASKNLFALSYYRNEKALPLLAFMQPETGLLGDIIVGDHEEQKIADIKAALGPLRRADIFLLESQEYSVPLDAAGIQWTEDSRYGGIMVETFLHNMMVAETVVGDPSAWEIRNWQFGVHKERHRRHPDILPGYIDLEAQAGDVSLRLICGKHIPTPFTYRGAFLHFESGEVAVNFDRQSMEGKTNSGQSFGLHIAEPYKAKYGAQMELFRRFAQSGGWQGPRIDGFDEQISVLRFLHAVPQMETASVLYNESVGARELPGLGLIKSLRPGGQAGATAVRAASNG